jgi:hypothetical protein
MTTLIPYAFLLGQTAPPGELAISFGVISLLFIMLVEKEFIRAYDSDMIAGYGRFFDPFIWSLLCVFVYLIAQRFAGFIGY